MEYALVQNPVDYFHRNCLLLQDIYKIHDQIDRLFFCMEDGKIVKIATDILQSIVVSMDSSRVQAKKVFILQSVMEGYSHKSQSISEIQNYFTKLIETIQKVVLKTEAFFSLLLLHLIRTAIKPQPTPYKHIISENLSKIIASKELIQFSEEHLLSVQSDSDPLFLNALNGFMALVKNKNELEKAIMAYKKLPESKYDQDFKIPDSRQNALLKLAFIFKQNEWIDQIGETLLDKRPLLDCAIIYQDQKKATDLIKKGIHPSPLIFKEDSNRILDFLNSLKIENACLKIFHEEQKNLNYADTSFLLKALAKKIYFTEESIKELFKKVLSHYSFAKIKGFSDWTITNSMEKKEIEDLFCIAFLLLGVQKTDQFMKYEENFKHEKNIWNEAIRFFQTFQVAFLRKQNDPRDSYKISTLIQEIEKAHSKKKRKEVQ